MSESGTDICKRLGFDPVIWSSLKNSLYPGAKDESIVMVLEYCKAASLDPMLKPVHIVPMSVKDSRTGKYEWRDVIMPGIGLYRIHASRSGQHAGTSEPIFGDIVTINLDGLTVSFPEWCMVIVKKRDDKGNVDEFAAKEFWLENYAKKDKDSKAPNSMWAKRIYGQLAKCAEAQALRKAFPELGSQPTAEEMEGKIWEVEDVVAKTEQKAALAELEETLLTRAPKVEQSTAPEENCDIEDKISNANKTDDLLPLMSEINSVKEFKEKKRLNDIFNKRLQELKNKEFADQL